MTLILAIFGCILLRSMCTAQIELPNNHHNSSLICSNQDTLKIPFVTVLNSKVSEQIPSSSELDKGPSITFSTLILACIGHFPIEWDFNQLPVKEEWNVTYSRVVTNIRDESSMMFESHLTFRNVSSNAFSKYRPTCQQVSNSDCYRCTVLIKEGENNAPFSFDSSPRTDVIQKPPENCTSEWSFSFDKNLQLFYCFNNTVSNATMSKPTVSFRKCSNPTECGNLRDLDSCLEDLPSSEKCSNTSTCEVARMLSDLESPTVVTCSSKSSSSPGRGVYLHFFHSTVDSSKTQYPNIYFNWKDADTEDLVYLEFSKPRIISQESFDISCTSSYYYFAHGSHLTLKDLSDPLHLEVDLISRNVSLLETVEVREEPDQDMIDKIVVPVKRTLLAQGVILSTPGDFEITCYTPVWNSFHWVAKSVLISVTESLLPNFVNGNATVMLKFHPQLNISCIAKARPAPKLKWIFSNDLFGMSTIELDGSDEMVTWSFLTMPKNIERRHIIKCRAENLVGFVEKVFIIEEDDDSYGLHNKIAGTIMILGFIVNLIILFYCWKHLFSEKDSSIPTCFKMFRKNKGQKKDACAIDAECGKNCCEPETPPPCASSTPTLEIPTPSTSSTASGNSSKANVLEGKLTLEDKRPQEESIGNGVHSK